MAAAAVFPLDKFRVLFPQFAAVVDTTVELWASEAECMLRERQCSCGEMEWMLLTAHLLAVNGFLPQESGGGPAVGNIASASIDKVSVSFTAPPVGDNWSYWLGATPFGRQLLALLDRCRAFPAGGFYTGGLPERRAFRSVYGVTPGRGFRR